MRRLGFITLSALLLATPVAAQEDEGTRLERLLEDQLSDGDGFDVDLEGFRGAITSSAELDRMTISDADGPWLILENAQLNWTRSALLRGRLSVQSLSAERLQLLRPPVAPDAGVELPTAEATPFSLPDLPVSVEIGEVRIDEVSLGEPMIGIAATLSVNGSVNLADGAGQADLDVIRQDGPSGIFDLSAAYDNATRDLSLDLLLEEDPGGLVAELLGLPGAPDLRLSVAGAGPITDFATDIVLETEGTPRLTGRVLTQSTEETADQVILVDLSGDISPLILPDYRSFFGDDVALASRVTLFGDGRTALEELRLSSQALTLNGNVFLRADGQPQALNLTGAITNPSGDPVRLPVPEAEILVDEITLNASFDAAQNSNYDAVFNLTGLNTEDLDMDRLVLDATGTITEGTEGAMTVTAVTADLDLRTEGVDHIDPALAEAIGAAHTLAAEISWQESSPVTLADLSVTTGDMTLTGDASLALADGTAPLTFDLTARAPDLARFAAIAGQPLDGALRADLSGTAELLSGAFDVALDGTASDLRVVDGLPPALLAGDIDLTVTAMRDGTGTMLETLVIDGAQIDLTASGQISSTDGALTVSGRLADIGLFTDVIRGPVTADLDLNRTNSGPWGVTAEVAGPAGINANLNGDVGLPDNAVALSATGNLPLTLANRALAPRSLTGMLRFDLGVNGPPALASVSGQFSSTGARISLPTLQTALEDLSVNGQLTSGRVAADVSGALATGGQVTVAADVNLQGAGLPADVTITGRNLRLVDPTLYEARIDSADLRYTGAILGASNVSGNIVLGESELRVPETGLGTTSIPNIAYVGETAAQLQTRIAAGLVQTETGGDSTSNIGLDLSITAPGRIFLRGRGLDAELGGALRLTGTTADVVPQGRFELIRGRLSILGTRLDLTDGSATLQGSFDPFIRLLASSDSGDYRIGISLIGPVSNPEITFTSDPALPEDEVLAQLLFGRSVSALSPIQLLQLADAAASLAGGSTQSGVFANLREGLGLDDLDLQTDSEGGAAVRAGRYLSDNIYTDVTVGTGGDTDISLNIDLTDNLTGRGTYSSDGESSLGLFFERDY